MHGNFIALLLAIASSLAAVPVMAACTSVCNLGGLTAEASVNFLAYEDTFTVYAK